MARQVSHRLRILQELFDQRQDNPSRGPDYLDPVTGEWLPCLVLDVLWPVVLTT